jgi:plasmid maintenance system killer protein
MIRVVGRISKAHPAFAPWVWRMHALSGRLAGVHSVSINLSYRITLYLQIEGQEIVPLQVGDQDAVY